MSGIRNSYRKATDTAFAQDIALATVGLSSPIAAGQTQHIRAWVPISVGATGGVRLQLATPVGVADFKASIVLQNTVAPSQATAMQTASAAFTNALANAGNHFVMVEATVTNGTTAGNLDLQFAQNTSDVLPLTVLEGAWMDATILS